MGDNSHLIISLSMLTMYLWCFSVLCFWNLKSGDWISFYLISSCIFVSSCALICSDRESQFLIQYNHVAALNYLSYNTQNVFLWSNQNYPYLTLPLTYLNPCVFCPSFPLCKAVFFLINVYCIHWMKMSFCEFHIYCICFCQ